MNVAVYAAPLQGYTDNVWRAAHAEIYGGVAAYFTPFIRVEKGSVRQRDVRNAQPQEVAGVPVVPQIIFANIDEFRLLTDTLIDKGASSIDLNLGCPFPPQVRHGRGTGALRVELLNALANVITTDYHDTKFSIKMRLGVEQSDEWRALIDVLNAMPLSHITLHPRVAKQQYAGEVNMEMFEQFLASVTHHVIYNGDIHDVEAINHISEAFGGNVDVMIGRGLLARPSLAIEYAEGEWSKEQRIAKLQRFHDTIYSQYASTLCGDTQILSKIKPMWDMLEDEIGHKAWKAIHKATTLPKYENAVIEALSI